MSTPAQIPTAIRAIKAGEPVIVVDAENRENEGDLILAAEAATAEKIGFFLEHTSGLICVAIDEQRADTLGLPLMVNENRETHRTAFTVSVDLADRPTSGISAEDRAATIRELGSPAAVATDFVRPGHVFPLRARAGGVLKRAGHTEAALDLPRLAGLQPAGALCEIVSAEKTGMASGEELRRLAASHGLPILTIADLVRHRLAREQLIERVAKSRLPTPYGDFTCHAWRSLIDGNEHLALVHGDIDPGEPVLVRVHSECLTGDVFHSERCDCGWQLRDAMGLIAQEGRGVVVYLRGHEGRGIGLAHKIQAYELQDGGSDTVDANLLLGLPVDNRDYGIGAQILRQLGVNRLRLLTNNPHKYTGLQGYDLEIVERIGLPPRQTAANLGYLETKRARLGHIISDPTEQVD